MCGSAVLLESECRWYEKKKFSIFIFIDILYRCTKNDQDAQVILNARRNDTNYVDILNEVIAYHDARASWSVPFYASIVMFI